MNHLADYEKNGALLAYIANRIPDIHLRKLLKIVFLIDEDFTLRRGYPLTWFKYYAWAKGPVAREVYEIKEGNFGEYVTARENAEGKWVVNSKDDSDFRVFSRMESFSRAEIREIDALLDKYGSRSADELTDLTHEAESLWTRVKERYALDFAHRKTSEVEIPLTMLLEGDEEMLDTYADAKWNMEFRNLIK